MEIGPAIAAPAIKRMTMPECWRISNAQSLNRLEDVSKILPLNVNFLGSL